MFIAQGFVLLRVVLVDFRVTETCSFHLVEVSLSRRQSGIVTRYNGAHSDTT